MPLLDELRTKQFRLQPGHVHRIEIMNRIVDPLCGGRDEEGPSERDALR
jgi:hypothetical protein